VRTPDDDLLEPVLARDEGLPRWVLPVALLGLVVLFISALPDLLAHRRLEAATVRAQEENLRVERGIEKATRDRRALEVDDLVLEKAIDELLAPGVDPRRRPAR
jgi:hypothetical protein